MIVNLEKAGFKTGFTSMYWAYATGFPKAMNVAKAVDKKFGESNKAKALDGSYAGFQPKPAVEVILVVMKPLDEKTYLEQAMKDRRGVSWFDDCRVPLSKDTSVEDKRLVEGGSWGVDKAGGDIFTGLAGDRVSAPMKITNRHPRTDDTVFKTSGFKSENNDTAEASPAGRFPANLLVSNDSLNLGMDSKSIRSKRGRAIGGSGKSADYGKYNEMEEYVTGYNDKGSFSRYYDLDAWYSQFIITPKASKSEKNRGLDHLPDKIGGGMNGTVNQSMKTGSGNERNNIMKNNHPTVKPIKLMTYLVTMGSRPTNTVLDPFAGSGTTGIACIQTGRDYILIEKNKDYYNIMTERLHGVSKQQTL
jgi:site-specific DNA-methyltransferase (adenine-specific)